MALFKIFKGREEHLPTEKVNGYAYFTTDEGSFYVDFADPTTEDPNRISRKQLSSRSLEGTPLSNVKADEDLIRGNLVFITNDTDGLHAKLATKYTELLDFDIGFVKENTSAGQITNKIDFIQKGHPERSEVLAYGLTEGRYELRIHGGSHVINDHNLWLLGEPTVQSGTLFVVS